MSNLDIAHCTLLIGHWRPRNGRFMGREHLQNRDVSWGHEPDRRRSRSQVRFTMYDLRAPRRADRRACESRRVAITPSEARKSYIVNRKSLVPGDRPVRIARFMETQSAIRNPQSAIRNPQSGDSLASGSEFDHADIADVWVLANLSEGLGGRHAVEVKDGQRLAAGLVAAEAHAGDVHLVAAHQRA